MAIKDYIGSVKHKVSKLATELREQIGAGALVADAELFPENNEDAVKENLFPLFKKWSENVASLSADWVKNRKAYMAGGNEHFGGMAALPLNGEEPEVYCSGIVADKIDDLCAMQTATNPTIYPLPEYDMAFPMDPNMLGGISPQSFLRKVWEVCIDDFNERRNTASMNNAVAKAAYLYGFAVTKQRLGFDHVTQQVDIFIDLIQPEHFIMDPATTTLDLNGCAGCFHVVFLSPMDAVRRYPEYREEILNAIITDTAKNDKIKGTELRTGGTEKESRNYVGKVAVVEAYLRDETELRHVVEVENSPDVAGLDFDELDGETTTERQTVISKLYPTGRRITFLPDQECILKDEPNPYPGYPFAKFVANEVDWSPYGKPDATPLRAIQEYTDKVWQQMYVNLKQCGNSKVIANSNILDGLDNSVGQKIPADHAGNVKIYTPTNVMGDAVNMHNVLRGEADQISGVYAPSEGYQSNTGQSGRAIGLLQESVNRKMRPRQINYEDYLAVRSKQVVDLMGATYLQGRYLRSSDEDGAPAILPWDLDGPTLSVAVRISGNTQIPADPMGKLNFYIQLLNTKAEDGLPVIDRQVLVEKLSIPGAEDLMRRMQQRATMQTMQGPQGVNAMNNLEQNMAMNKARSMQDPNAMRTMNADRAAQVSSGG